MNPVSPLFEKIDSSIAKKLNLIENSYVRYAVRAMLACMFLTLGSAIAFAIAMKGEEITHGLGKILYSFMFSWSLVMILYMNAELGTSNMLYMTVGVYRKRLSFAKAAKILVTCILFNLIGGLDKFDKSTGLFTRYKDIYGENSLVYNDVVSLHIDKEGILWIGTRNGLCSFDRKSKFIDYKN